MDTVHDTQGRGEAARLASLNGCARRKGLRNDYATCSCTPLLIMQRTPLPVLR